MESLRRSLIVPVGSTENYAAGEDHDDCASLGAVRKAEKDIGNTGGGSRVNGVTYAAPSFRRCSFLRTDNSAFVDNAMHIVAELRVMGCA